jgi:hypothetical protein
VHHLIVMTTANTGTPGHKYDHPNWTDEEWNKSVRQDDLCPFSLQPLRCRPCGMYGGIRCCGVHYFGCPGMSHGNWRETWADVVASIHPDTDVALVVDDEPWSDEFYQIIEEETRKKK